MIPLEAAVERYLERKSGEDGRATGSGTYTANASSILTRWVDWLADEYDVRTTTELERAHLAAYARDLAERTDRGEWTASTATTYFAVVRAFLSWCRSVDICETNPAADVTVAELLPASVREAVVGRSSSRVTSVAGFVAQISTDRHQLRNARTTAK